MIYLDNAASAPVLDCALSAAEPFLRDCWGNPSSIHTEGRRAGAHRGAGEVRPGDRRGS